MDWIGEAIEKVRKKRPLVHNITNYVVMNTTANALLSIGASPIMAHSPEELYDIISIADAVVINIGTLDDRWIYSMEKAARIATQLEKPVVLDPVGAGATRLRTETAVKLLENRSVKVVKGNYGELFALAGEFGKTKGVDSAIKDPDMAKSISLEVARKHNVVVGMTGPIDFVTDGKELYSIASDGINLEKVVDKVTGLGCIVSAITGAFVAVEGPLRGTLAGIATFKAVAELASEEAKTPGLFHVKLYDWLYMIDGNAVKEKVIVKKLL
jgi:hydroxyethylthiazole kinase